MVRYIYFSTKFSILESITGLYYAHSVSNQSVINLLNAGFCVNCVVDQISSRLLVLPKTQSKVWIL